MGTITGTSIINKAASILFDVNGVEWSRLELLGWVNDCQRAIIAVLPRANNLTTPVAMVAGTRQAIPADGWLLIDVYRNLGPAPGTTPGRVLRLVDKKTLDQFNPLWHAAPAASVVQDYCYDINDQRQFWVSPPSDGTGYIEVNYARVTADLTTEAAVIGLSDVYEPIILDYVVYRACEKRTDYAPGLDMAMKYKASYESAIAAKIAAETLTNPNTRLARMTPGPPPGGN